MIQWPALPYEFIGKIVVAIVAIVLTVAIICGAGAIPRCSRRGYAPSQ